MTLAIEPMTVPLVAHPDGKVTVGNSRVTLESVVYAYQRGEPAETIVQSFPPLKLADVHAVIWYYLTHHDEVEAHLKEYERLAAEWRRKVGERQGPGLTREELLARKQARDC